MAFDPRRRFHVFVLAVCALASHGAGAQTMYLSGQNVQPVFEGWVRNDDGGFTMVFGYLNRNYVEEPHIPVGSNNAFAPGPADRGQPTHFYPRRQQLLLEVIVPADWGQRQLVWTLTHNGRTSTATGTLLPAWAIDEGVYKVNRNSGGNFGRTAKVLDPNRRPSIGVVGERTITLAPDDTATLAVTADDDGKPGPRPTPAQPASEAPVAAPGSALPSLTSGGGPISQDIVKARAAYQTGLAVTWIHYRGPGTVTFSPQVASVALHGGKAATVARFSEPGAYVIRAVADDGVLTTPADVTVTVVGVGRR